MRLIQACLVVLLLAGTSASLLAQPAPIKWGDIPPEHLQMETYPADTNATAIILADYGTAEVDPHEFKVTFKRHRRIKILTEAGYDWGTVEIPFYAEDKIERVRKVEGQTFVVGPDGKTTRQKLDKKALFEEDIDGEYRRIRFTLPALEPGAVIEYRYTVQSKYPYFLPDWLFQTSEPTLWSEFRVDYPRTLEYILARRNITTFDIEEAEVAVRPFVEHTVARWAMEDLPALREEPFMTNLDDYRAQIDVQLSAFLDRGIGWQPFIKTWPELAEVLMDRPDFGGQLKPSGDVRRQTQALVAGLDAPLDKMQALYDFVRTSISWTGQYGFIPSEDFDDVLKSKSGDAPDLNLLLVAMMRAADLEAHPVIISTRSHGQVLEAYPLLTQFNYVLAGVRIGEDIFLLDATDPLRPYDLLPARALNGKGWLVIEKNPRWITVKASDQYQHLSMIEAELDDEGGLTGTIKTTDGAYSALNKRHTIQEEDLETLVRDTFLNDLEDVDLTTFEAQHVDDLDEKLHTEATFSVPTYAQVAGDFIYFNPMIIGRIDENPLHLPERTFPVDMIYPHDFSYTVTLRLPEGYGVVEIPKNKRMRMPDQGGVFQRFLEAKEGVLKLNYRFTLNRSVYTPREYADLRAFYDQAVAACAEQVVLKRGDTEVTQN